MTLQELVAILTPIALACRTEIDEPTYRAYHRVLKDVPAALAEAGLERLVLEGLRYGVPSAPEILLASEQARQAIIAAHPYDGCAECEDSRGWRGVLVEGIPRVERCPCRERHQQTLARMGVSTTPLALPAARDPEKVA